MTSDLEPIATSEEDELDLFLIKSDEYLRTYKGVLAEGTHKQLGKRYRRLARYTKELHNTFDDNNKPLMSTTDPEFFTHDDIKAMFVYLRKRGLSPSGIDHEISALSVLCKYHLNNCVEVCKIKYPIIVKKSRHDILPVYSEEEYVKVIECATNCDVHDYYRIRSYALICLTLYGGLRCKELQYARESNLHLKDGTILLVEVKGDLTYGSRRLAPLRPECIEILEKYLIARKIKGITSDYLFANIKTGKPLVDNSIRRIAEYVKDEMGFHVTPRDSRRAYAQFAADDGAMIQDMSAALGHASIGTTQDFYIRIRQGRIISGIVEIFKANKLKINGGIVK